LKLEDVHFGGVGGVCDAMRGRSVVCRRVKWSFACGSLERCTMSGLSQAGVLCEMTTRADETDRRRRPSPRRDVNQAMVGSAQSSQPLHLTTPPHSKTDASRPSFYFSENIVHESWVFCETVLYCSSNCCFTSTIAQPISTLNYRIIGGTVTTLQQACSMRTETLVQCLEGVYVP
jgi:hypothetical protein